MRVNSITSLPLAQVAAEDVMFIAESMDSKLRFFLHRVSCCPEQGQLSFGTALAPCKTHYCTGSIVGSL